MVAKILFTSNFNFFRIATLALLGGSFFSCQSDLKWIRELPNLDNQIRNQSPIILGTYSRPQNTKSALGSKSHSLIIGEWIEFKEGNQFLKKYIQWETRGERKSIEIRIGKGSYRQVGPWILISTKQIFYNQCEISIQPKFPLTIDFNPCPNDKSKIVPTNHDLLYHYEITDRSIAHLQYESGYVEANFGIGWEVTEAYLESSLFKKIRTKYTKKEFQPHVYYNGRLD